MKILDGEISLREETRALEQAKPEMMMAAAKAAATGEEHANEFEDRAFELADTQEELAARTESVIEDIRALPEGEEKFGKEIQQLTNAAKAMWDADQILGSPDSGSKAIAAETEAIEWLLQAKRSSSGGGGGGGSTPGDGNRSGQDVGGSALALIGASKEKLAKNVERDRDSIGWCQWREFSGGISFGSRQSF